MLTLGIPATATMAVMLAALTMQGIATGPQVMLDKPDLFWGLIASMWIGNFLLVILNLPLVGVWVKLLSVPYRWLFPSIILFCCIGIYSVSNNPFDVYLCALIGVLGYVLVKLECEPAPLLLGYVLGPLLEENLRRALLIARGDPTVFFTRPISLVFMIATVLILVVMVVPAARRKRHGA
jgi:TctA family transporter